MGSSSKLLNARMVKFPERSKAILGRLHAFCAARQQYKIILFIV